MHDFINVRRAIMENYLLQEFSEVVNDETIWKIWCAPEFFIFDLDHGVDAGRHGFTLNTYKDELCSARELSFSRRYYLSSFVGKGDNPFIEWDIILLRI